MEPNKVLNDTFDISLHLASCARQDLQAPFKGIFKNFVVGVREPATGWGNGVVIVELIIIGILGVQIILVATVDWQHRGWREGKTSGRRRGKPW
jgi:hypothetical protein